MPTPTTNPETDTGPQYLRFRTEPDASTPELSPHHRRFLCGLFVPAGVPLSQAKREARERLESFDWDSLKSTYHPSAAALRAAMKAPSAHG